MDGIEFFPYEIKAWNIIYVIMLTLSDVWGFAHPYINHALFGLLFGYIGYVIARHYKIASVKMRYGIPLLVTVAALAVFKFYESTLPVNTPTPIPGVFLNTVGGDMFLKSLRQVLTVVSGGMVPLVYEKIFKK